MKRIVFNKKPTVEDTPQTRPTSSSSIRQRPPDLTKEELTEAQARGVSPFTKAREKAAAAARRSAQPAAVVSSREAVETQGFLWFRIVASIVAIIVDYLTNLAFTSPHGVTALSASLAFLLMITELLALFFFYQMLRHLKAREYVDAAKSAFMLVICLIGVGVDFWATVDPVERLLMESKLDWGVARFFGVFTAALTSYFQVEFIPQLMAAFRKPTMAKAADADLE